MIDQIAKVINDMSRGITGMLQPHIDIPQASGGCPGCAQRAAQAQPPMQNITMPPTPGVGQTQQRGILNMPTSNNQPSASIFNNASNINWNLPANNSQLNTVKFN